MMTTETNHKKEFTVLTETAPCKNQYYAEEAEAIHKRRHCYPLVKTCVNIQSRFMLNLNR